MRSINTIMKHVQKKQTVRWENWLETTVRKDLVPWEASRALTKQGNGTAL